MNQLKLGAILSYITIFLNIATGIFLTPFMIEAMGKGEYGLYVLIGSLIGYISVLDFGMNNTIVRFVAKYRAQKDKRSEGQFLGTTFKIYLFISFLVLLVGVTCYFFLDNIFADSLSTEELSKAKILFQILLVNLAITLPGGAFNGIISGYEHFVFPRVINVVRLVVRTITLVSLLSFGYKAIAIVLVDTFLNVTIILLNICYCRSKLKVKINFRAFKKSLVKVIFSYSVWIFLNVLMDQMYWKVGQTVLGIYTNTSVVAVYAIAMTFVMYYMTFSTAISGVFLPRATQMFVNKATGKELICMMAKVGRLQWMVLSGVLVGFLFFGKQFISLWVGDDFMEAWLFTLIIMIPLTVPLVQNFGISILQAYNKHRIRSIMFVCIAIINVFIGIGLTKIYGGIGMALGTGLSLGMGQIIAINLYYHFRMKLNILLFVKLMIKGNLESFILILTMGYFVQQIDLFGYNWLNLMFKGILFFIAFAGITFGMAMNQEEKNLVTKPVKQLKTRLAI